MTDPRVLAHWNARARLGDAAGTPDVGLKQLEQRFLVQQVRDGMRVIDAGCGTADTAVLLAQRFPHVTVTGFDAAPAMVRAAQDRVAACGLQDRVTILAGDVTDPPLKVTYPITLESRFDLVYTERCLINLPDWPTQRRALEHLWGLVEPRGGRLVLIESCQEGLTRLNELRRRVGLSPIEPPWHNRYLRDGEVRGWLVYPPDAVIDFTSTYYLASRVFHAALAHRVGQEPAYDAPLNQVALQLPPLAEGYGQTWAWCWTKR